MEPNNQMPGSNQQSYQNQYTATPSGGSGNMAPVMTMGDWVKTMLLLLIPIANIVFLIIWATSSDPSNNPNRKNWAKAQFIMMAIGLAIWIVLLIITAILGAAMFSGTYY